MKSTDVLAIMDDAGVRIIHLDPFARWVEHSLPDLPGERFPIFGIAFDVNDFFRMAAAFKAESHTAPGRYSIGTP
jgi:hypothetical protein